MTLSCASQKNAGIVTISRWIGCLFFLSASSFAGNLLVSGADDSYPPGGNWSLDRGNYKLDLGRAPANYAEKDIHFTGSTRSGDTMALAGNVSGFAPPGEDLVLTVYRCPATGPSACLISTGSPALKGPPIRLSGWMDFSMSYPSLGISGVVPGQSSICFGLADEARGKVYKPITSGTADFFCADAEVLPKTPPTCNFTTPSPTIDFGTLERSSLPTEPGTTASKSITLTVNCVNDFDPYVFGNVSFSYDPVTISGSTIAGTNLSGIGVAVYYNGTLVEPDAVMEKRKFELGNNSVDVGFSIIRDKAKPLADIPVGDFSASISMIVTEL